MQIPGFLCMQRALYKVHGSEVDRASKLAPVAAAIYHSRLRMLLATESALDGRRNELQKKKKKKGCIPSPVGGGH
jgi:hypothetical protein